MSYDSTIVLAYNKIRFYLGFSSLRYTATFLREKWKIKLLSEGIFKKFSECEISEELKYIIKSNYVLNWSLGIPLRSNDFCIFVREDNDSELEIVTIKKIKINFEQYDIPSCIMKKWFDDDWDKFLEIFNDIWPAENIKEYMKNIEKIVKKYAPEQIWWPGNILTRIDNLIK